MPFFQGKYNFETHGGTFHDVRRHRYQRLHHRNSNQPASASQPQPSTEQSPHLSESLRSHLPSVITHTDSVNSEKSIDEEAQTIPDSSGHLESMWGTLADKLPRLIHAQFLLHLPSHYFDRVDRLSRDGNMALKEILDMAVESNTKCGNDFQSQILDLGQSSSSLIMKPESLPPAYRTLTIRWGCFIDDLLAEWKTLNLVSALLVPGILTMFQVTGASNDPVTRYLAFWSLISALVSLLYGCAFIIQFTRMRKPSIAIEWAFEARNPRSAFWSVGILLSLPVVWLAWSIVAFIVCIMAFMWRCNANPPDQFPVPPPTELAFRIFVSAVLAIGCLYGILIYNSFQRYGPQMDEALSRRIDAYIASASSSSTLISQSTPEPHRSPDSPSFEKPHKQKSRNRKSRSTSPSLRPASPSPLVNRSVSLGQNPSTIPYQPSPLSNSTAVPQQERQVSTSGAKPSDASQDKLDPKLLLKVASTRKPRPPPNDVSNDDAPRYEQAQSTRSGRILTASPKPVEEIRQEQAPGNDHILYDPTDAHEAQHSADR